MTSPPPRLVLDSPVSDYLGCTVETWEPDHAVLGFVVGARHINRIGTLHGGIVAALLDNALGLSGVWTEAPAPARPAFTLSLTTDFIATAQEGTALICEGWRTGGGRSIYFARGEIRTREGELIATAQGTFRYTAQASLDAPRP